jgi:hypothetical protein
VSLLPTRRPGHATIIAYTALFVALGGGAYAATSGSLVAGSGAIKACVDGNGGLLTVVKQGRKCPHGKVALSLSTKAQTGAPGQKGATGATGLTGPMGVQGLTGPATAVVDGLGEATPAASPNEAGFVDTKTIVLPTASRLLVYASGLYGFNCEAGSCTDQAGLYVDNVPVPNTRLDLTGPSSQFATEMGITAEVLAAGPHTIKWTDQGGSAILQSGPVNSTGVLAGIATD